MRASHDIILDGRPASAVVLPVLVLVAFTGVFVIVAIRRLRFDDTKVGFT
jgi:hypothetical protein